MTTSIIRKQHRACRKSNLRWNGGINYLFLKDEKGQLKLSVHDLLNQNISVNRVTRTVYQDNQTTVLRRYFLLTFTYNTRSFGAPTGGQKDLRQRMVFLCFNR